MSLIDRFLYVSGSKPRPQEERHQVSTLDDLIAQFAGFNYQLGSTPQGPPGVPSESSPTNFEGIVKQVYYRNGVVAACMAARLYLFAEARFKWRNLSDRKMFGTEALGLLEGRVGDGRGSLREVHGALVRPRRG